MRLTDIEIVDDGVAWLASARAVHDAILPGNHRGFWQGQLGPYGRLLVGVRHDEVVGYLLGEIVMAYYEHATIHELGVATEHQGTGIGTMLLHRFAVLALEAGCQLMYVKALPGQRHAELLAYYAARGFTKSAVKQGYQRAPATRVIAFTSRMLTWRMDATKSGLGTGQ